MRRPIRRTLSDALADIINVNTQEEEIAMTTNIRRFAAVASLTIVLTAAMPVTAAPTSDRDRDRSAIIRVIKKIRRLIGLQPAEAPVLPVPAPSTPNPS
jgi:hypothetical protein